MAQIIHLPLDNTSTHKEPLQLNWIAPGTFVMGSPTTEPGWEESARQFEATLTHGYWIGQYPVTQSQWKAVMGSNPSHFQVGGDSHPVDSLNWKSALSFCRRLNRIFPTIPPSGYAFSLPTDVQWEYACRAGTRTMFSFGDSGDKAEEYAWFWDNSGDTTHPVGLKKPNDWGLYDMHGNVLEWCFDGSGDNPEGPKTDWIDCHQRHVRTARGGAYCSDLFGLRSGLRNDYSPKLSAPQFGLRLALRHTKNDPQNMMSRYLKLWG